MTVGDKIRILRLHNNWTQKYLAQIVGVTELTIRNYESGKSGIRQRHLDKLSEAFEIDPSVLTDNCPETINDIMQMLFSLRDEFGLRVTDVENVPARHRQAVIYFENEALSEKIGVWKNKQIELNSERNSVDLLIAWELLFPNSFAKDCKVRLDMHRKRGKINRSNSAEE